MREERERSAKGKVAPQPRLLLLLPLIEVRQVPEASAACSAVDCRIDEAPEGAQFQREYASLTHL